MMFAKYFEYYTIILRGGRFCGHAVVKLTSSLFIFNTYLLRLIVFNYYLLANERLSVHECQSRA